MKVLLEPVLVMKLLKRIAPAGCARQLAKSVHSFRYVFRGQGAVFLKVNNHSIEDYKIGELVGRLSVPALSGS